MSVKTFKPTDSAENDADALITAAPHTDTPVDKICLQVARTYYLLGRKHQHQLIEAPDDERSVATGAESEKE